MTVAIDQIVFGWTSGDSRNPETGVKPVAWSVADRDRLRMWETRLLDWVRMEDVRSAPPPERSYVHQVWKNGEAVVLRRNRSPRGTSGQEVAHALIGPADVLTARTAWGLDRWQHWQTALPSDGAELTPLSREDLADRYPDRGFRQLPDGTRPATVPARWAGWLPALLARTMHSPRPVSVFTDDDPLDGLGVFLGVLDLMYTGLDQHHWTFSTWETADHDDRMPGLVFLPKGHLARGSAERRQIVDGREHTDQYVGIAAYLVDRYCESTPETLRDSLDAIGLSGVKNLGDRLDLVRRYLHDGLPNGAPPVAPVTSGAVGRAAPVPVAAALPLTDPVAPARRPTVPSGAHDPYQEAAMPQFHGDSPVYRPRDRPVQTDERRRPDLAESVDPWAAGVQPRATPTGPPSQWAAGSGAGRPGTGRQPQNRMSWDPKDVHEAAAVLADLERLEALVRDGEDAAAVALARRALDDGSFHVLADAYGIRWLRDHGLPEPDPQARPGGPQSRPRADEQSRTDGRSRATSGSWLDSAWAWLPLSIRELPQLALVGLGAALGGIVVLLAVLLIDWSIR